MDNNFGHWLAGLIAGEGCFRIHKSKSGAYYACHFALKLRDDDQAVLKLIVATTKIGHLKPANGYGKSHPLLVWTVHSKSECLKLVELLDQFPIRAKKAREYTIWREAVYFWINQKRGNRWHGPRDWSRMIAFKLAIENTRAYR